MSMSGHRTLGSRGLAHTGERRELKQGTLSSLHGRVRSEAGQFSNGNIRLMTDTDHRRGRKMMVKKGN